MSDIKPGDRVRVAGDDEILEVIAMSGELSAVSSIPKDPDHRPVVLHTAKLELVEVAHYAPPGVAMVAMTPERIHALAWAIEDEPQRHATIIHLHEMLREARGEA